MSDKNFEIQEAILMRALDNVPFDGWSWLVIEQAGLDEGHDKAMVQAVFPDKLNGALSFFSKWADRKMLEQLDNIDTSEMGVRDHIEKAVITRLEILEPYKESVRAASVYWLSPLRKLMAAKIIWSTADVMWKWAGDNSTDYNHYTKRGLLSGVLASTTVTWLNDTSDNHQETLAFLSRRLDNVLTVGKFIGKFKPQQTSSV